MDDSKKFAAPGAQEELYQGTPSPMIIGTSPIDGLPMQVPPPMEIDRAPRLTEETLICMADKRSYVRRDSFTGEVLQTYAPEEIEETESGIPAVLYGDSEPTFEARRSGIEVIYWKKKWYFVVEPIRPVCAHYFRQHSDLAMARDRRFVQRACLAQKNDEGEFYTLRDQAVYACTLRSPRHPASEKEHLDHFDEQLITEARAREAEGEFDVEAELAKEAAEGRLGVLGG
jgi:hypothetical protein